MKITTIYRISSRVGLILLSVISLTGCEGSVEAPVTKTIHRIDLVCDELTMDKRAEFILSCIANANPKSDEEPEDWIKQCQRMAEATYCPKKEVTVIQEYIGGGYWRDITVTPVLEEHP